jgi:uncharacterized protein (DUF305 family)
VTRARAASALVAVLVLAGCGSTGGARSGPAVAPSVGVGPPVRPAAVQTPEGTSDEIMPAVPDAMFLQMLIAHDHDTDRLLATARGRALSGPARELVAAIRATQAADSDRMASWLRDHGQATTSAADPDVHAAHGGTSALTAADLSRLRRAEGPGFERELLNLLLGRQHTAVELARATTEGGDPWVRRLADRTEVTREAEIARLLTLLTALPAT